MMNDQISDHGDGEPDSGPQGSGIADAACVGSRPGRWEVASHDRDRLPVDQSRRRDGADLVVGRRLLLLYTIGQPRLEKLRSVHVHAARIALERVVEDWNQADSEAWGCGIVPVLAEAGYDLFTRLIPSHIDETARKVRDWLEGLRADGGRGRSRLEVVVEEHAKLASNRCAIPWNLIYDTNPEDYRDAFDAGKDARRWGPFWGLRYDLSGTGRCVEPLRRQATWEAPARCGGR